ncbi:MAG: hypothetical protein NC131_15025 [Roseburia sp.]|nr:hypothetical protein [Roseburia sp.]
MSDETSEVLKISITIIFAAVLLSSAILVNRNSKTILDVNLDKSNNTKGYVSSTNILNLQTKTRTATDLYKIYSTYEESINSISGYIGEGSTKQFKVFYLRSCPIVDKEAFIVNTAEGDTTYDKLIAEGCAVTGDSIGHLCNIDRMSSDLLTDYGFDSFAELQCYITTTTDHNYYDIYFYDLRE